MKKKFSAEDEFSAEIRRSMNNFDKFLVAKTAVNKKTQNKPAEIENENKRFNVFSPKRLSDIEKLIDCLKSHEGLVVSLAGLKPQAAQRILDFLSGAVYAINGRVAPIADKLYLLTPSGIDVATKA